MNSVEEEFRQRLSRHLTRYYRDTLGLGDLAARIRYREIEERIEEARLKRLADRLGWQTLNARRVVVVGSGWGGMCLAAARVGADVFGIDVDPEAIAISRLRFRKDGRMPAPLIRAAAENLPFRDNSFDLAYCFSVLEHVQTVDATIGEMARVVKPGGYIYISAPNSNIPWEGHYKMVLPTFLGRRICKTILRLRRRNPAFLDTLNFIHKGPFLQLVEREGLAIVDSWDICREPRVSRDNGVLTMKHRHAEPSVFPLGFDEYLGLLVRKAWSAMGVTDITVICQRRRPGDG